MNEKSDSGRKTSLLNIITEYSIKILFIFPGMAFDAVFSYNLKIGCIEKYF